MYQVMVVDDEPMAASLIVNIIKQKYNKFEIMGTAYNGEEALELMQEKGEPDILITDIQMPVMNGYEATKVIRKMDRDDAADIPIIAMTAHTMKGDAEKCLEAGMQDHIAKPIDPETLFAALQRARG